MSGWSRIEKQLETFSTRRMEIIRVLIDNSVSVKYGKLFVNDLGIPTASVAKVANVDHRLVHRVIHDIERNPELRRFFGNLRFDGPSSAIIGRLMNLDVLEVLLSTSKPGTLARIAALLARNNVSIRSLTANDPEFNPFNSKLIVVVENLQDGVVRDLLSLDEVERVALLSRIPERDVSNGGKPKNAR